MSKLPADTRKILVVDDEFDIIQIVRRYLEKWGFNVDAFTNPLYALQTFKQDPNAYSVALLDIRMPEMTGIRLANLMLEVRPKFKVVIMTAYDVTPAEMHTHLPTISHDEILQKPFRLIQICNAVKKQLAAK